MNSDDRSFSWLIIVLLAYLVAAALWMFQLIRVAIQLANPSGYGWMNTDNFFAWVVVFIMLSILMAIARGLLRLINVGLVYLIARPLVPILRPKSIPSEVLAASIGAAAVAVGWVIGTVFITGAFMGYLASDPQITGWLSEGSLLAHILTYFTILGIALPQRPQSRVD